MVVGEADGSGDGSLTVAGTTVGVGEADSSGGGSIGAAGMTMDLLHDGQGADCPAYCDSTERCWPQCGHSNL